MPTASFSVFGGCAAVGAGVDFNSCLVLQTRVEDNDCLPYSRTFLSVHFVSLCS